MRPTILINTAAILLTAALLTGCSNSAGAVDTSAANEAAATEDFTSGSTAQTEEAFADTSEETNDRSEETSTGIPYTWQEITVTLPAEWEGLYVVQENDNGFSFCQKSSYETEEGMGYLCGFYRIDGMVFGDGGLTQLAYTDDTMYCMSEPTDVPYVMDNQKIADEYGKMAAYNNRIAKSLKIDKPNVKYDAQEYVMPMSEVMPIEEDYLMGISDDVLSLARNEIFARHGLLFTDYYLQCYFDSCSWYTGSVNEIEDGVLSKIEEDNIALIKKAEADYKASHPYPKEYPSKTPVKETLSEEAGNCTIKYEVTSEDEGVLTINGNSFLMSDFKIVLEIPETEAFYITDISPYFDGLEIVIVDDGNNDNSVNHFFTYTDTLHYLGAVPGHLFESDGRGNSFANEGAVWGTVRTELLETAEVYRSWWYDYDGQKLQEQNYGGMDKMVPEKSHELYVDLPVYYLMDEGSDTIVIPAQKQVFFLSTDGQEWILVKGKDGTQGYVHVDGQTITNIGKDASQIFSDLNFAG